MRRLTPETRLGYCSNLIIVGASVRAAAQSAIRAGFTPWGIDLFGDRDLEVIAPIVRCPLDQYPHGLPALIEHGPAGAPVMYTGALENHPHLIKAIAAARPLIGCEPDAVRRVRQPRALASLRTVSGLRFCKTHLRPPTLPPSSALRYLIKPLRGTGGRRIRLWSPDRSVDHDHYLQQYVEGTSISAIYFNDDHCAHLLGATEQLIGDDAFGATEFEYCGSVGPLTLSTRQRDALIHLGTVLAQRFNLRGPIGVDAVIDLDGDIWPVEINPRYTASVELLERATGQSALVAGHGRGDTATGFFGKAIVFAQHKIESPDLYEHFESGHIADVPNPGTMIRQGWPVCTVLATGNNRENCLNTLRRQATSLYAFLRQGNVQ